MAVSMVLDPVQVRAQKKHVQGIVEGITGVPPTVYWRYSAYSNERFPLRAHASALCGLGPNGEEILVIAVTWRHPRDDMADRLIVSAEILDGEGAILAESPRFEVPIQPDAVGLSNPEKPMHSLTDQLDAAMHEIRTWLGTQRSTIQEALAQAP